MSASDSPPIDEGDAGESPPSPASPRAFATATGFVFQVAGAICALGSCCIASISGFVFSPASSPAEHWFSYLSADRFETAMATLLIVVSLVGGLGLVAAGIGMQAERPRSGGAGMWASGLMAIGCGVAGVARLIHGSPPSALIGPVVIGVMATALFLLAGHSRQILRQFPAPADQNVVDDAFLEEHRRSRRRH